MSYCRIPKCEEATTRNTYDSARSSFDEASSIQRIYERHSCDIDSSLNEIELFQDRYYIEGLTYDELLNREKVITENDRRLTPLDKFLIIRGLEQYCHKFRILGAKTVKDLKYLDSADFIEIGITKRQLLIKID